jgi:proline iminopeptidase
MRVKVNGVRLFFDVEGPSLVPDGATMRRRETLILLHGGPGFDHSRYKPAFSELADVAQVIYLDHRGNGRSDDGPPDRWTLAQWGDDVRSFCDALEIERPIVYGASFGGFVALAYATRHPDHPAKLILASTAATVGRHLDRSLDLFERYGGGELRALAQRFLGDRKTDPETIADWVQLALRHYTRTEVDPNQFPRMEVRSAVMNAFIHRDGELFSFDLRSALAKIRCRSLVLGGEDDPITPIEDQADIVAALPEGLAHFERFPNCGHEVIPDAAARAFPIIRAFIAEP